MKKLFLLLTILSITCRAAFAQYYRNIDNTPALKIGVGLSSGFAVGPVSNVFPEAGGFLVNLELPLKKSPVSILFSTGYTFYVSESGYSVDYDSYGYFGGSTYYSGDIASFIPLEAGLKVKVANRVFIEGLIGASFNVNTYTSDYTGKPTALIYSPGVGYSFPLGFNSRSTLDLSLVYENRPEPGGGYSQIGVKGIWNFSL